MSFWLETLLFVAVVPLMCLGVSAGLALMGGWHRLASHYAVADRGGGLVASVASVSLYTGLLPMRYRGCITVQSWADGFGLSVLLPLRFMHPPLLIPWSAIRDCRQGGLIWKTVDVILAHPDVRIRLYGRAGAAIHNEWMRVHAAESHAA
jgi:hypothetical protein